MLLGIASVIIMQVICWAVYRAVESAMLREEDEDEEGKR